MARALICQTPVLNLDEAVSAPDTENEHMIQEMLNHTCRDVTVLVVAHRLSTMLAADKLVVLDYGEVAQVGNPVELKNQLGVYRDLIQSQLL